MQRFKQMPQDPNQIWLMPPSLNEMVSEDDEVRVLSDIMEQLDWDKLESSYHDRGTPPYPPRIMTKILVFAYSKGIRSSRKIEELLKNDVRYMWLAGCLKPDFHTIARFRKEKFDLLSKLFADSVRLCKQLGLVNLNIVAVDGTKIPANVSRKSLYDPKRVDKELEAVNAILREADEVDNKEDKDFGDHNGREVPKNLRDAVKRKAKLEEIKAKLVDSGAKTISSSDEDSRMMKTSNGLKHSFNVQTAVDSQNQVIVAMDVTNFENDHRQLAGMVEKVEENCEVSAVMVLADTGYCDEPSLEALEENEQEGLISVKGSPGLIKDNNLFHSQCFIREDERDVLICPAGHELVARWNSKCGSGKYKVYCAIGCKSCSFRGVCVKGRGNRRVSISFKERYRHRMIDKLKNPAARAVLALRGQIVEPVFGQIKENRQFRCLSLRGFNGAIAEVSLAFLTHNILKCRKKAISLAFTVNNSINCKFQKLKMQFLEINIGYKKMVLGN
jgi:transposase